MQGTVPEELQSPADVKRLGDTPVVIKFASNGAKVEVAARAEHCALLIGPFGNTSPPS
jgi:hypothetical protein